MTDLLPTILILGMLATMAAKSLPVVRAPVSGKALVEVPVPLLFRLLGHRANAVAILVVLMLGSGMFGDRWVSHGLFLFAVVAMVGIACVPTRYRLTTDGLSPSPSVFRPWSDFERWEATGNVVYLSGKGRFASLKLYATGKERDELQRVLRRYLPGGGR